MTITEHDTHAHADSHTDSACSPDGGCAIVDQHGARMGHPAFVVPGAMDALQALGAAIAATSLPVRTIDLVNLRVSQINGCAVCLLGDLRAAQQHGETDERIAVVAGWREAPFFSDAERAALALAEAMTRLADRADAVSDDVWDAAARQYDEQALAALVLQIANINVWNRLNVATRQVAGAYEW
jgi:AhpD family alkylhydroperoxidase